jgi:hypothetical protein
MEGYLLLELNNATWNLLWRSNDDARTRLGHRVIAIADGGLETLTINGDSWLRGDEKSQIFGEANAGPHRYFEQTWVRTGNSYDMTRETVQPSSYNTLVEFVYRLRTGDEAGAGQLVTDAALIETAVALGLAQDNDRSWSASTDGGSGIPPWFVSVDEADTERAVQLFMVESTGDWLISAIDTCTPSTPGPSSNPGGGVQCN